MSSAYKAIAMLSLSICDMIRYGESAKGDYVCFRHFRSLRLSADFCYTFLPSHCFCQNQDLERSPQFPSTRSLASATVSADQQAFEFSVLVRGVQYAWLSVGSAVGIDLAQRTTKRVGCALACYLRFNDELQSCSPAYWCRSVEESSRELQSRI